VIKGFGTAAATALLALAGPAHGAAGPGGQPEGYWINPHNDVAVRTGPCGDKLCGWIVWANAEAQSDARDGGVSKLLGTELLENYGHDRADSWAGTVFVPDMGRRFSSRIEQISPTKLQIKGCILGGLICRTQVWHRIERLPGA